MCCDDDLFGCAAMDCSATIFYAVLSYDVMCHVKMGCAMLRCTLLRSVVIHCLAGHLGTHQVGYRTDLDGFFRLDCLSYRILHHLQHEIILLSAVIPQLVPNPRAVVQPSNRNLVLDFVRHILRGCEFVRE